ncbi:MAG: tetratricopeptide repeat protein [Myxococcales bacterium]
MGQSETKGASAGQVQADDSLLRLDEPLARYTEEPSEPSYSQVLSNAGRANALPSVRPSARPSIRPSAFGPPRTSTRPPAAGEALPSGEQILEFVKAPRDTISPALSELAASLEQELEQESEGKPDEPTPTGPRRKVRAPEQGTSLAAAIASSENPATFRADLEDLLPFVSAKHSVPPTLPALPEKPAPRPQDLKRNRISVAIFGAMLLASVVPLARYLGSAKPSEPSKASSTTSDLVGTLPELAADVPPSNAAPSLAEKLPADPMLEALAQAESNLPADPVAAADQLMNLGLKALANGDERFAEALLGRALKRDDDNPRAYFALAKIRMSQGNLQGAEGWVVSALHKRPRRAEYHALYATVLEAMGRTEEAAKARARAEELR